MKNYLLKQIYACLFYPFIFVCIMWLVFFIQEMYPVDFSKYGILPRDVKGIPGIIFSVFVHGDLSHIASNSVPVLVLGMMVFYFYKKIAKSSLLWIWLIAGIWLWVGGRNDANHPVYHIGASGMIYGMASFIFFSGVFRRHLRLMVISALVVFLYGSMTWGIFPFKPEISWEGHLFGAIAGALVAFNYRNEGPKRKIYQWENEEEENTENENQIQEQITFQYHYKPNEKKETQ